MWVLGMVFWKDTLSPDEKIKVCLGIFIMMFKIDDGDVSSGYGFKKAIISPNMNS